MPGGAEQGGPNEEIVGPVKSDENVDIDEARRRAELSNAYRTLADAYEQVAQLEGLFEMRMPKDLL
jgi:hypothetical protein